jgi:glycosyltransferase involved in cell wall biosynthesis
MSPKPRLCFLGPLVGRHPGYITTQAQILADFFTNTGYNVISASSSLNRYIRFWDINQTLLRKSKQIDIVLLEVYSGRSFVVETIAAFLSSILELPLVLTLHGGNFPVFFSKYPKWSKYVLNKGTIVTAPSHYLIHAIEPYGFKPRLIPNVINLTNYPFRLRSSVSPRLIWMRSFHEVYHPEMAIEVVATLKSRYPNIQLVMAGQDKGLMTSVQELAQRRGVSKQVLFPGFLNSQQKTAYFSSSDIFINTNRIDNMPVAVVEACAMGLPVVSTSIGGIPFLLTNEETGLLVPGEDASSMAEAVTRLLEEPGLASKLSSQGRELAERSSWESVRPMWEEVFTEIMEAH